VSAINSFRLLHCDAERHRQVRLLLYLDDVLKDNQFIGLHPLIEEDQIKSPLFPQLDFILEEIFK